MRNLPELQPGTKIGPYTIGAELGRGGIATVYEAVSTAAPELGPLAIKIAYRTNENRDKRFIREFERLRVVALPGVVRVYDAGTTDQLIWYVMDQIEGQPMSRALANAPDLKARIDIAIEAGARMFDVLAGIHRLGFIHRDIKPSNILIGPNNETHVLDFGLVRHEERGDTLTRAGRLVGTVAFMSPEQTTGLPLTTRTDIFSAGLVLYEGLVGARPRPHKQEEWLGRMCLQQVTPMAVRDPRIPRDLSAVVSKLLTIDPHARPSAVVAAKLLRQVKTGQLRNDWPSPPRFIGREKEVDECVSAFDSQEKRLFIIEGEVGTGRRRMVEQIQRRALLYGTPRVSGVCRPHVSGGAVQQIMEELFRTHADPEWRSKAAGPDVGPLLSMWPTLPLPAPPTTEDSYTLSEVARAAAHTIQRGVESVGLMIVFQRLDQVDRLTANVIQMLIDTPPERMAIYATMEPRWATPRARKLVDHLVATKRGQQIRLPDLSSKEASELASSLNDDSPMDGIDGCSPQLAVEQGLQRLAARRGEKHTTLPTNMAILGLATFPLPEAVLRILHIDPKHGVAEGLLHEAEPNGYILADNWLRQRAQSLVSNRTQCEDALADALTRASVEPSKWANIARHMIHGRNPHRALAPAIHAAVHATQMGRFNEARSWLMAIDPMKRDPKDPTYRALRFELSWARARTSLATDLARLRMDLIEQARSRAKRDRDHLRCDLIEAELRVRQGQIEPAVEYLVQRANQSPTSESARCYLKIARIYLDQGDPAEARKYTDQTRPLGTDSQRALLGIDLALLEGRAKVAIAGSRNAIDRYPYGERDPIRGTFLLRLGTGLLQTGDRVGATQAIHKAREILVSHGHRARLAEAQLFEAILAIGRGHARTARIRVDPVIATARAFSSDRLLSMGWALKLHIAAIMNDRVAARSAITGHSAKTKSAEHMWRLALSRWYRTQRDLPQAINIADYERTNTFESVALALECTSSLIAMNSPDEAKKHLAFAIDTSKRRGYAELGALARVMQVGLVEQPEAKWYDAVHTARASPWLELSMTGLAMEGRQLIRKGALAEARVKFQDLLERAEHLDNHYHRVVANEALVNL